MDNNDSSPVYQFIRESHDGRVLYVLLPIKRLSDAIKVLNLGFYPFENVSICTQVAQNPKAVAELNELSQECIKDGVSIVAIDKTTDQIIGVSINKIQKKSSDPEELSFFEKFVQTRCKEKESTSLINFMIECDAYVDVFDLYATMKVMEIMFLAVLPEHRKRNIGLEIVRSDLQLANQLSINFKGPEAVVALYTSEYSRKIGASLQFDTLKTMPYSQFKYDGVQFSDKLAPEHTGIVIMAKECKRRTEIQEDQPYNLETATETQ